MQPFENILQETQMCWANATNLMQEGKFDDAKAEYDKAYKLQEDKYGKDDASLAICHMQIGLYYTAIKDFDNTIAELNAAIEVLKKTVEYNNPLVANIYYLLAGAYMEKKDYEQAAASYGHLVIISSNIEGEKSEALYHARIGYNKAMLLAGTDTEHTQEIANQTDPEKCYNDGLKNYEDGLFYLAVLNFKRAAELKLAVDKDSHDKQIIAYYRALSIVYNDLECLDEAKDILTKLLALSKAEFGDETTDVAATYNLLGYNRLLAGDTAVALDNLLKMLDINIKLYGEMDTEIVHDYGVISQAYILQNDLDNALTYTKKAENILLNIKEQDMRPDLARCYGSIADIYDHMSKFQDGVTYNEKQLKLVLEMHDEVSQGVMQIYQKLAQEYQVLKDENNYKRCIEKMTDIYQKLQEQGSHDECGCGCGHDHHHDDECGCGHEHHHDGCDCDCDCDD